MKKASVLSLFALALCVGAAVTAGAASPADAAARKVKPSCRVPAVVGRTPAFAKARIRKAHCRVGKVRYVRSSARQKNRVVSQRRSAVGNSPRARGCIWFWGGDLRHRCRLRLRSCSGSGSRSGSGSGSGQCPELRFQSCDGSRAPTGRRSGDGDGELTGPWPWRAASLQDSCRRVVKRCGANCQRADTGHFRRFIQSCGGDCQRSARARRHLRFRERPSVLHRPGPNGLRRLHPADQPLGYDELGGAAVHPCSS